MAQQTINIGASPNDGTGDFVRAIWLFLAGAGAQTQQADLYQ